MAIQTGSRIGIYKVLEQIGAGGMGKVYRAQDTKLGRDVAIKVLPEKLSQDKDRIARFEREARLLASLNHPYIATVHGLEEADGELFLVMELVLGETLAERIARGPIPIDEAIPLFQQIAEGLEAAHDKDVVHRDLKPANIKLDSGGKPKILDFGLAKAFSGDDEAPLDSSQSPTLAKGTALGVIMGTASYMSPEQARGKRVDTRADVWAFGCCLFEALTGKKAFEGETVTDTLAAVVKNEPEWDRLPPDVSSLVRFVLMQCLKKNPDDRTHDIADTRVALSALEDIGDIEVRSTPNRGKGRSPLLTWVLAATAFAAIAAFVWSSSSTQRNDAKIVRFSVSTSEGERVQLTMSPAVAVAPDGKTVVYSSAPAQGSWVERQESPLYVRALSATDQRAIPDTEGAMNPVFSPNGDWIAFVQQGTLKKVPLAGGTPVDIAEIISLTRGMSWGRDGFIYFQHLSEGLFRVSAEGGIPETVVVPDPEKGEKSYRFPHLLPGEKTLLYTISLSSMDSHDEAKIAALSLEDGSSKTLIDGGANAKYTASGHLVFTRNAQMMAAPFDVNNVEVLELPVPVVSDVITSHASGTSHSDVSRDGVLAYVPGTSEAYFSHLYWLDRDGNEEPFPIDSRDFDDIRISPDGERVALWESKGNDDIWIFDIARETLGRVTSEWDNYAPRWTPDGESVFYASSIPGRGAVLTMKAADGSGGEVRIAELGESAFLLDVSPDGAIIVYGTPTDILLLPLAESDQPVRFTESDFSENDARIAPDGRWIAYDTNESGQREVVVQPFPEPGRRISISSRGGVWPVWNANGRELFYLEGQKLISVDIQLEPELHVGASRVLFERPNIELFDVAPDGEKFLVLVDNTDSLPARIEVVLNWFDELERLAPTK